jgi:large subunit ribosomal protein L24
MSSKLRQGDKVIALTGNDKGKTGQVIAVRGNKLIIEGLNIRKKHVKATQEHPKGRIVEMEMPIERSNLSFCTEAGKPAKLRVRQNASGERELYYHEGDREVVYRSLKKSK